MNCNSLGKSTKKNYLSLVSLESRIYNGNSSAHKDELLQAAVWRSDHGSFKCPTKFRTQPRGKPFASSRNIQF